MIYLKNAAYLLLTFFLVFTEVWFNTFLSASEYLEILPILIYVFFIINFNFSRSSVILLICNGFYYDLFFTDNFLGYTSIKLLLICMTIHFAYIRLNSGIVSNFILFYVSLLLYKFEILIVNFDTSFILLVICLPNFLLFNALTSNLRRDVFSAKI